MVRSLSIDECKALLPEGRVIPVEGGAGFRQDVLAGNALRLVAGPPSSKQSLSYVAQALIRWLPPHTGRLLILADWWDDIYNPAGALALMREPLGERRTWRDAPAMYVEPQAWSWDQLDPTPPEQMDSQVLGLVLMSIMDRSWDAWMLTESAEALVNMLEGNVVFYSRSERRLDDGRLMMKEAGATFKFR